MREFGSEHSAILLPDGYFDGLARYSRELTYLRTGREALLYVSYNCEHENGSVVLCPSYSCWSMVAPFEYSGWTVVFYRLNADLTIDEDYLDELLNTSRPSALLTMNYYGSASTRSAIAKVKAHNEKITVIEDFSHCTFCLDKIYNDQVDFYVTSIRKSIGICDGAMVMSKKPTDSSYIKDTDFGFGKLRLKAQRLKGRYAITKSLANKEEFLSELKQGEAMIEKLDGVHPMSDVSSKILGIINAAEIAFARCENMKHMWRLLNGRVNMVPGLERGFDGAPFSMPILVENRNKVQIKLAQQGVYAPVLWPIEETAREVCKVSAFMSDHMLSIPIDQRYDYDDIEDMASVIIKICE